MFGTFSFQKKRVLRRRFRPFRKVTNSNKAVSIQTISRAIRNDLGLTYKRLTKPAAFDNLRYTEVFMYYLHQQVASRFKFFDQSGFNTTDSSPVYGHWITRNRSTSLL